MDKNRYLIDKEPSVKAQDTIDPNCFDAVNNYGTYEIQPTADTDNEFPEISQGLPEKDGNKE